EAGLAAYRGDGALASWVGALVDGRLPPLPPLLAGLLVTGVLAALGLENLPGILVLTPIEAMMLAALGARHPHDGRLDWLVPALLLAGEGVFLAALGLARHVAPWVVFALLAAVLVRHVDLAWRARAGGCGRTRTRCPRPCCRSTGWASTARSPSSTSRCATWRRSACATS